MNVFELRDQLVDDYRDYTRSFIKIRDPRIREFVDGHLGDQEAIFRRHPDVFGEPGA